MIAMWLVSMELMNIPRIFGVEELAENHDIISRTLISMVIP